MLLCAVIIKTQKKPTTGGVLPLHRFVLVDNMAMPVNVSPVVDRKVEPRCPITGMTEERSAELSRAMLDAIERIDPRQQRFVKA